MGFGWSVSKDQERKGQRYRHEQIIYALKRVAAGEKANEGCRPLGVSEPTF